MRKTAIGFLLAVALVAGAEDSPLVALARRTNRKLSKTPVITNETLAHSKGRMAVGSGDALPLPSVPAATSATPAASAAPAPQRAAASSAATATSTSYAPAYPPSTARNIDPQVTARTIDPQSTLRTYTPPGAARIDPQTTARTIDPASTAKNIDPQSSNRPPQ